MTAFFQTFVYWNFNLTLSDLILGVKRSAKAIIKVDT